VPTAQTAIPAARAAADPADDPPGTRRAGTVIYVPEGDSGDLSRPPHDFDEVFDTLKAAGCSDL
jgi:hypothetical protein